MSARLPGLVWALHAWHSRQQATWARNWPWFLLMGVAISWLMMTYTRSQSRVQGLVEKRASNHQPVSVGVKVLYRWELGMALSACLRQPVGCCLQTPQACAARCHPVVWSDFLISGLFA